MRDLLFDLYIHPVFPEWDAVKDGFSLFCLCFDASVGGFGASLERERSNGPLGPIVYICPATFDNDHPSMPLDLELVASFGAQNINAATCGPRHSRSFPTTKRLTAS